MGVTFAKWSVVEYHALIASGALDAKPVELLRGNIVDMSPEGPLHSNCIRRSANEIRQQLTSSLEVSEAHPITLEDSEPEPDIAIILAKDYDECHPNAADVRLVIEFARSSLEKDLEEKRLVYAQANIPEYWVINLTDRRIIIFHSPEDGDYSARSESKSGIITSKVIPSISVAIATPIGKPS
ncbi:MAG: Uma2 family endonuclease [Cyanobacteria bacterium J06641_5]